VFVLGEAIVGMRRNLLLGFAATTTAAIALYVLASMAYIGRQAAIYVDVLQSQFEMTVNLKPGTDPAGISRTAKYLRTTPGVGSVVWVPAARRWEKDRKAHPELTEGYGFTDNIYPDALRVRLNDLSRSEAVASKAKRMSTVDAKNGVIYYADAQRTVARWIKVGRELSLFVGGFLLAVSAIVIWNSVSLTVASRATEVRIMRLVGASRIVIALPFVLEGVLQGVVAGAAAAGGLVATRHSVEGLLRERAVTFALAPVPLALTLFVLCGVGGGYGGLCSLAALRASLRARRNG